MDESLDFIKQSMYAKNLWFYDQLKIIYILLNHVFGLASRNTIFYGPIVISVLFFIHIFLSPQAILSSSIFIMFFLLKHLISHLFA